MKLSSISSVCNHLRCIDIDEPIRNVIQVHLALKLVARIHLLGDFLECDARRVDVERLFLRLSEDLGEVVRN